MLYIPSPDGPTKEVNMKLQVFALALLAAASTAENPQWANEEKFGKYQDAWMSIKSDNESVYYLAKATYTDDEVWGKEFTCLSVKATSVNPKDKSIEATITYKNKDNSALQTSKETVTAVTYHGYQKENAITYKTKGGKTFTDILVFSDGQTCDIYHVPGKGYELWTADPKKTPPCCEFIFTYFAGGNDIRDVYTPTCEQK